VEEAYRRTVEREAVYAAERGAGQVVKNHPNGGY
jgi:hypothetical protein